METITQEELDDIENCIKHGDKFLLGKLRERLLNKFKDIDKNIKLVEQRFGRMYIRSIIVPANTLLLGKPRATENSWICIFGDMITRKSDEDSATEVHTGDTVAGIDNINTWRIAITKSKCKWSTIHKMPLWVPPGKEEDYIKGLLEEPVTV